MAFMSEEEKKRQERLELLRAKHGLETEKSLLDKEIPIGNLGGGGGIKKLFRLFRGKKKEEEEEESDEEMDRKERQADENLW